MTVVEKKTFVCQNSSCRQTFIAPLKTLNLQANPTEPYYACPYCLSKVEDPALAVQQPPVKEPTPQRKQSASGDGKPEECKFYLGYLSERAQKEQIPDDCILCKSIVECMLKKMRDET